jgi:curved DNA-binding protein CbpA
MASTQNLYSFLGITRNADAAAIKQAYREMAMKWHPDKNPGNVAAAEAMFHMISDAYATLSDPSKRAVYNAELDAKERTRTFTPPPSSRPTASSPFGRSSSSAHHFAHLEDLLRDMEFMGFGFGFDCDCDSDDDFDTDYFFKRRSPQKPIDPFSVHIVNLGSVTSSASICDAFSKFGRVVDCHLMRDRRTGAFQGKGFVRFATPEGTQRAVSARNIAINGRVIGILRAYQRGS